MDQVVDDLCSVYMYDITVKFEKSSVFYFVFQIFCKQSIVDIKFNENWKIKQKLYNAVCVGCTYYVRAHYMNCTSKLKMSTHKKSLRVDIYLICCAMLMDIFCFTFFFYSIYPKIVVTTYILSVTENMEVIKYVE